MAPAPSLVIVGGWSWHRHVGDDAILRAHLSELAKALPNHEPVVVCGEPERFAARTSLRAVWSAGPALAQAVAPHAEPGSATSADLLPAVADVVEAALEGRADELHHLIPLVEAIAAADGLIAASAGSLAGAYPLAVAEQVVALAIAQAMGKPTAVSGASLGPFDDPADGELLGPVLAGAGLVTVRDATISPLRARALGVAEERLRLQPDPAFWMEPAPDGEAEVALRAAGLGDDDFGVLTLAPWPGGEDQVEPLAPVVDAVAEQTGLSFLGLPMFVPPGPADDVALDSVAGRLADPDRLVRVDPLPDDPTLLALSGLSRVVVGSRFHGAVLAAAAGSPSVLVHDGAYQRDKAESLAAATASVRAVPLAAGSDAIAEAVLDQIDTLPDPVDPPGPLPAVEWLAGELRGRSGVAEKTRRWARRVFAPALSRGA